MLFENGTEFFIHTLIDKQLSAHQTHKNLVPSGIVVFALLAR
jgi:hypothetical protein